MRNILKPSEILTCNKSMIFGTKEKNRTRNPVRLCSLKNSRHILLFHNFPYYPGIIGLKGKDIITCRNIIELQVNVICCQFK